MSNLPNIPNAVGRDRRVRRLPALSVCIMPAFLMLAAVGAGTSIAATPQHDTLQIVLQGEDFHTRHEAAARLGRNLDGHAIEQLIALLEQHTIADLTSSEAVALKDILCTVLENQTVYPAQLPKRLIAMYRDTRHAVAWRDYCIQHLNTACTKIQHEAKPAVYQTFWAATAETDSTIAGTALIALADHRQDPAIALDELQDKAVRIATDPATSSASRLTAIQIAAELGDARVLPTARILATTSAAERRLRLSAIAAIGILGTREDLPLLHELATASGHVPGIAARTALAKLQARYPETKPQQKPL